MHSFARVIAPFFLFLYPVYLNFYVTNLSGQQRDLQLCVESEPHRGLTFYHQKYNPLTPWWNERGLNPCLSGREWALNPLSHQADFSFILERKILRSFIFFLANWLNFFIEPWNKNRKCSYIRTIPTQTLNPDLMLMAFYGAERANKTTNTGHRALKFWYGHTLFMYDI